jgi:hypothetical protein
MFTPLIFTSNDQATKRSLRPNERLVRLTAYLASLFNAVISDLKSLLSSERRDRMVRLCKDYGFDTEDPNFDPAFID